MKFWTKDEWKEETVAAAEACLLGELPKGMVVVLSGREAYLVNPHEVVIREEHPLSKAVQNNGRLAYRMGRRMPLGMVILASEEGIVTYAKEAVSFMVCLQLRELPAFLHEVFTVKEAATVYGLDEKDLKEACEKGDFPEGSARRSDRTWLLARAGLQALYGVGVSSDTFGFNPLLFVFSTTEASKLWNRSSGEVRSAAAGAGHRNARMDSTEARKSGVTWLVTREAMERVFGPQIKKQ